MLAAITLGLFTAVATFSEGHARPVVVFDLDHTLFDTNPRIVAIIRDLGAEYDIPEFFTLSVEDIAAARLGRTRHLGLDPEKVLPIFSKDTHNRLSPFGRKFYGEPAYFIHDGLIPGAPEFVARIARELEADIVYLTGRFVETHAEATSAQLRHWSLPGYNHDEEFRGRTRLIMKSIDYPHPTEVYKATEVAKYSADNPVLAVFDDASRNVNAMAKVLPEGTPIVRLTRNVHQRGSIDPRVDQITNFMYDQTIDSTGRRVAWRNIDTLDGIIARAKACASRLVK